MLGLVALMNVVNFSDGIDGLAAGVCAISAVAFSIIAFDLGRTGAGVLAAIVAGAAIGFLFHNFHPASVFMGDCGALLLGFLLGCVAVQGSLKTNALIALVGPLAILAVPFLDTSFVIARRLKYRRAPWSADAQHFHHRFSRIGFSQRRTVLYLYAWTVLLAGLAVAMRFIPYTDNHGNFNVGWSLADRRAGAVRRGRQRLPRRRAGDPQAQAAARLAAAPRRPSGERGRDRRARSSASWRRASSVPSRRPRRCRRVRLRRSPRRRHRNAPVAGLAHPVRRAHAYAHVTESCDCHKLLQAR